MSKQDQIDRLGERVGELEITVNGDDLGNYGLRDQGNDAHDAFMSLRDEVTCLQRRVKALEPSPPRLGYGESTAEATQAEPNGEAPDWKALREELKAHIASFEEQYAERTTELAEWKARAEKAEAELEYLKESVRGFDSIEDAA